MTKLSIPKPSPLAAAKAVSEIITAAKEWGIVHEQEKTKRVEISAMRDVMVEQIKARRELLVAYLEAHFQEKALTLNNFFDRLDVCLETGNLKGVEQMVAGIVSTVKISPIGDIATLEDRMENGTFTLKLGEK